MKKSLYFILFTVIFASLGASSYAQPSVDIGPTSGTSSYFYGPYYRSSSSSSFNHSNYAYLYTSAELGIPPGAQIIEVAWLKESGTITGNNKFNLWMENNNATSLSSTTWSNLIGGATQVYTSTTQSFTALPNSYESFPLSSPFIYTGGSLTIITEHEKFGTASAANNFYYESVTGKAIGYASSTPASGSTTIGSSSYSNRRPTIRITYLMSGFNDAGVSELTAPLNFCPGNETIKVKIANSGINIIDSVKVGWSLDGVAQTSVNVTTTLDTFGGAGSFDLEVTLGTHTFTSAPVDLVAWTYLPNGSADTSNMNDTISATMQASLSGIYTINAAQVTSGTNYQSFTDLTDDLNTYGVCGPVVVNVSGGPYNEFVQFTDISGTSATNTIRINGNGAVVQYNNDVNDRQMLILDGAKYVTIDSLVFKTMSSNYGWAALITNGAAYDSILNCFFDLTSISSTSSSYNSGIVFSGSSTSATTVGSNGSHCYVGNNHIKGADGTGGPYYGMGLAGTCDSNIIENNIIENFYYYGLRINGGTGNKILNNEFHKKNKTASFSTFYGIYTTGTVPGLEINGNRIHHPGGTSGYSGTFYGIYALGDGTIGDPVLIANNAIYGINYKSIIRGIYLSTSPYNLVYQNTIVIDEILTGSSTNYGIYATGNNTEAEIKNNNISITGGSAGTKYGVYYSTSSSIEDAQKNNIYVNSTQAGTQYYGYFSSAYATKAAFQAAHPTLEVGSPDVDPMFVNPLIGDFNVQNPQLIGSGENLSAWVPEDINGNPRSNAPTIGAFEKPPSGENDAAIASFVTPAGTFCSGQQSVSVSIYNAGINNINNVQVHWEVDGVAQPTFNYTGTLVPIMASTGQNADTVVLGSVTFLASTPMSIKAWTSLPNSVVDTANLNDTILVSYQTSLSGLYTINSALATTGTNFQSFADFSEALNLYGICGPVVANVSGGPFIESVKFDDVPGSSAVNTIHINGAGAIVQFTNTSSDRQLLTLDGTKYLTIDSLNFKTLSTSYGWAALITGGATYDSIKNCTFDLSSVSSTSSSNNSGIVFSASATSATSSGFNGSHCFIGNNHVKGADGTGGPYYGMALAGDCDSNVIMNNIIENFYYYGLRISGTTGNKILHNEFHKQNKTASFSTFYGIYTTGITAGLEINSNRIHHPGGTNGYSGSFYGIYALGDGTATNPVLIANNVIYNVNYHGILRGINLSTAPYNLFYHNTIVFDQINTGSSINYGIYATGTNTGLEIKNNNVSITGGSTGTKYGFYYSTSASVADAQKNNFYVNSTQGGTQNYGYYTSAYATKAAFQAAYPTLELGSPDADPVFFNPAAGDFNVQSPALIGNGVNLTALVPTDINGNTRLSSPTIGAFEQAPAGANNAGAYDFISPDGTYCSGSQSVSLSIMNAGTNDITSLQIHWTVNGVAQPLVNYTDTLVPLTATSGQNMDTVVLGNANIPSGTPTVIKAWTSLPNGIADVENANDTVSSSFQSSEFYITSFSDTVCSGRDVLFYLHPDDGYQTGEITWQNSLNGTTWTDIPNSDTVKYEETSLTSDKWFRVKIGTTNSCYTDSLKITVINVAISNTTIGEHCGPGTVTIGATGSAGTTLKWFADETSSIEIGSGTTFTTPFLNETDTFYVSAGLGGSALPPTMIGTGAGSTTGSPSPFYNLWDGKRTQYLVKASELNAAGFSAGTITSIGFDVVSSGNPLQQFTVSMGQTTQTTLSSTWISGLTEVYSVPLNTPIANQVNAYTFTTPFVWDGASNIVIQTCYYNGSWGGTYAGVKYTTGLPFNGTHYLNQDNNPSICTTTSPNAGSTLTSRPNIQFEIESGCESPREAVIAYIRPFPDVDLGADIDACVDNGSSLSIDAGTYPNNPAYLWQDNSTSQFRQVNTSGDYSVVVTNEFGCSGTDTVNVQLKFNPEVDLGNDTTICIGETFVLDAGSQGISYFWNTGEVTSSITVDQTGTYNVIVTNAEGCVGQDTINIIADGFIPTSDGLYVTNIGANTFKFQAINPENDMVYDWNFGDGSVHSALTAPTHTYAAAGNYLVKLKILGSCGFFMDSTYVTILGINDLQNKNNLISIYPNPTNSKATIKSVEHLRMNQISIYNTLGQQVFVIKVDKAKQVEVDLKGLASGLYTVQIQTDKGNITRKLEVLK